MQEFGALYSGYPVFNFRLMSHAYLKRSSYVITTLNGLLVW
jgi:hypothetical protein